jgi:hypothetical protein
MRTSMPVSSHAAHSGDWRLTSVHQLTQARAHESSCLHINTNSHTLYPILITRTQSTSSNRSHRELKSIGCNLRSKLGAQCDCDRGARMWCQVSSPRPRIRYQARDLNRVNALQRFNSVAVHATELGHINVCIGRLAQLAVCRSVTPSSCCSRWRRRAFSLLFASPSSRAA